MAYMKSMVGFLYYYGVLTGGIFYSIMFCDQDIKYATVDELLIDRQKNNGIL